MDNRTHHERLLEINDYLIKKIRKSEDLSDVVVDPLLPTAYGFFVVLPGPKKLDMLITCPSDAYKKLSDDDEKNLSAEDKKNIAKFFENKTGYRDNDFRMSITIVQDKNIIYPKTVHHDHSYLMKEIFDALVRFVKLSRDDQLVEKLT